MRRTIFRRLFKVAGLVMALIMVALAAPVFQPAQALAAPWPSRIVYNLYATDGWTTMADGVPVYLYGYIGGQAGVPMTYQKFGLNATGGAPVTIPTGPPTPTPGPITAAELAFAGHAQLPGPVIYARTGDIIEVHLKNLGVNMGTPATPNDPHTIHWHGVDQDAAMDGVPETSLSAIPANGPDPGAGNVIVYEFTVNEPGTYFYHCHQEASIHIRMGMYGAMVIYNPRDAAAATGPGMGQGGQLWGHKYDKDYIMLLTEWDSAQSAAENTGVPGLNAYGLIFAVSNPMPDYWLINGLSFPNTIHAPSLQGGGFLWDWWIPAHPGYETFYEGSVNAKYGRGEKVLIRMINIGFQAQPMHIHGFHGKVLGMDQRAWLWANPPGISPGQGMEMNTPFVAAGQTLEFLLDFGTIPGSSTMTLADGTQVRAGNYSTQTYSKVDALGNPVLNTDTTGLLMPDPFFMTQPARDMEPGPAVPNLFPWHNHDDYKATNVGLYPGGQFTMLRVNP